MTGLDGLGLSDKVQVFLGFALAAMRFNMISRVRLLSRHHFLQLFLRKLLIPLW